MKRAQQRKARTLHHFSYDRPLHELLWQGQQDDDADHGLFAGRTAARTYVEDYGNKQGLDYAVMLAPMGGNNGRARTASGRHQKWRPDARIENKVRPARGLWDRKGDEGGDVKTRSVAGCRA